MLLVLVSILVYSALAALVPLVVVTAHQAARAHATGPEMTDASSLTPTLF